MASKRPMFLNLMQIRFPVTAIVSILHRVTGVLMFLALPGLLYLARASLLSPESYQQLQQDLQMGWLKCLFWLLLAALSVHIFAGVRHIVMDLGWGESFKAACGSAWLVLVLAGLSAMLVGVWLW